MSKRGASAVLHAEWLGNKGAMRPIPSFSRGTRTPADPARAMRRRRERLIDRTLETQRRLSGPSRAIDATR